MPTKTDPSLYKYTNQRPPAERGPGPFEGPSSYPKLCWWSLMCAWHGALTELLVQAGSHKTPAVTGRKGHGNKARAVSRNGASEGSMRQNPCT